MKIFDRYILRSLLVPLALCLAAFCMLYVVFDLFDNLADFNKGQTPLLQVARFYVLLMPSVMVYIVPISLLLATLYCLSQLVRHNELTAMRASGISLHRLMTPILMVGLLGALTVWFLNESVGPSSAYWTDKFIQLQRRRGDMNVYIVHQLSYYNNRTGRDWYIDNFDTRSHAMQNVTVNQRRPDGSLEHVYHASQVEWLDGRWWFSDAEEQRYNETSDPIGPPRLTARREMIELTETPRDFMNEVKDPLNVKSQQYLSAAEILEYLQTHDLSDFDNNKLLVDYHYRLSVPWVCLLAVMLGIPFGATTSRKGAMRSIGMILAFFLFYYVLVSLGLTLGKQGKIPPLPAIWLPTALIFVAAAELIRRMRH